MRCRTLQPVVIELGRLLKYQKYLIQLHYKSPINCNMIVVQQFHIIAKYSCRPSLKSWSASSDKLNQTYTKESTVFSELVYGKKMAAFTAFAKIDCTGPYWIQFIQHFISFHLAPPYRSDLALKRTQRFHRHRPCGLAWWKRLSQRLSQ